MWGESGWWGHLPSWREIGEGRRVRREEEEFCGVGRHQWVPRARTSVMSH